MTNQEKANNIKEIIKEKVLGVYEAAHTDEYHRYINTKTGFSLVSVTSKIGAVVSKGHLMNWAVSQGALWLLQEPSRLGQLADERSRENMIVGMQLAHKDIKENAGQVGTVAHNCLERYTNQFLADGELPKNILDFMIPNADPRSIASARAAEVWFHKHDIIPIWAELLCGDDRYSAGQIDFIAFVDGKVTLIDYKTSNSIAQTEYSLQVSAYKFFFERMTGVRIQQCKILWLSKDMDKFFVYKVNSLHKAYRAFRMVSGVYDWIYKSGKDKIVKDIKRLTI